MRRFTGWAAGREMRRQGAVRAGLENWRNAQGNGGRSAGNRARPGTNRATSNQRLIIGPTENFGLCACAGAACTQVQILRLSTPMQFAARAGVDGYADTVIQLPGGYWYFRGPGAARLGWSQELGATLAQELMGDPRPEYEPRLGLQPSPKPTSQLRQPASLPASRNLGTRSSSGAAPPPILERTWGFG